MTEYELAPLLAEQKRYYGRLAPDYLAGGLDLPGGTDLVVALDAFEPGGDVLELACGPGSWTPQLLRYAASVTAVDSSSEMLALARERVGADDRVDFVCGDVFAWRPERRYDVVFFGFWLSHVPLELFAAFWALVADCLTQDGRVFFADDAHRTPDELINGEDSPIVRRRLPDGTSYRAVKIAHTPASLEQRLADLGWNIQVHGTEGPFYWGSGARA